MQIITETLSLDELSRMAAVMFGNLVKAVVDVDREIIAVDAELHADLEALLLQEGAKQESLWGVNLYPDAPSEEFIEFDSMINIRPAQKNRTRGVEDETTRARIKDVVTRRIKPGICNRFR